MPGPSPLATDYADRLTVMRDEAGEAGQTDLDYILTMAIEIAERRIKAQELPPVTTDPDTLSTAP